MKTIETIIVKTSSTCNLGCKYCYATSRSPNTTTVNSMSINTLEVLIKNAIQVAGKRLEFVWHGGEPLLLGIDFYRKAIELQRKYNLEGIEIINSLQTNGTLITKDWVTFFKNNNMCPGISLDGPRFIHNSNRTYASTGSFDHTMRGVRLMREQNLYPNVLSVVSSNSLGYEKQIFDFFTIMVLIILISYHVQNTKIQNLNPHLLLPKNLGSFW